MGLTNAAREKLYRALGDSDHEALVQMFDTGGLGSVLSVNRATIDQDDEPWDPFTSSDASVVIFTAEMVPDPFVAWAAETSFDIGATIRPGAHHYTATLGLTTGETEPEWTDDGNDVEDGDEVWSDAGVLEHVPDTTLVTDGVTDGRHVILLRSAASEAATFDDLGGALSSGEFVFDAEEGAWLPIGPVTVDP